MDLLGGVGGCGRVMCFEIIMVIIEGILYGLDMLS